MRSQREIEKGLLIANYRLSNSGRGASELIGITNALIWVLGEDDNALLGCLGDLEVVYDPEEIDQSPSEESERAAS